MPKETEGKPEAVDIPWPEDQPVVPMWPTAARPFKVARSRSYQLASRGEFPVEVLRVGGNWMVVTANLRRKLGLQVHKTEPVNAQS
jgi:hypothetical protein